MSDPNGTDSVAAMPQLPSAYSHERLVDRAQVTDLLHRYARSIDRLDAAEMRAVFHPDATDNHGVFNGPTEGFADFVVSRHQKVPFSAHLISNTLIDFVDTDTAVVESYATAFQTYPADARASLAQYAGKAAADDLAAAGEKNPTQLMLCGRYVDVVTRRNGEWRIQKREVVLDAGMVLQATPTAATFSQGRRDQDDPIYQTLAAYRK